MPCAGFKIKTVIRPAKYRWRDQAEVMVEFDLIRSWTIGIPQNPLPQHWPWTDPVHVFDK